MVVLKPLYRVPEASTHWFTTYHKHYIEKLSIATSTYNLCLLITQTPSTFRIVGIQTNDTLILVQEKFAQLKEEELIFTTKPKENLTTKAPLIFNSCILTLNNDGSMDLRQNR